MNPNVQALLVVPEGTINSDDRTAIVAALHGDVVEAPSAPGVDPVPNLVLDPARLEPVREALDLTLGWLPDDDEAVLTLDCRRSDLVPTSPVDNIVVRIV
ncbi:MAG: hypothetical protein M3Q30_05475 [Actinomycetota bacterium]|nr:hypothetical protein [Actinomycetota bacterium]